MTTATRTGCSSKRSAAKRFDYFEGAPNETDARAAYKARDQPRVVACDQALVRNTCWVFDTIANLVDNAMKFDGEAARATAEVRYSSSSTPVPKRQQIMERIEGNPETAEQLADCLRTATRSRSACSVPP